MHRETGKNRRRAHDSHQVHADHEPRIDARVRTLHCQRRTSNRDRLANFFSRLGICETGRLPLSSSLERASAAETTHSFTASQFLRAKKRRICVRCNLNSAFMPTGTESDRSPPNCCAGWSHARLPAPPAPTRRSIAPGSAHPGSESAAPSCPAPESSLAA